MKNRFIIFLFCLLSILSVVISPFWGMVPIKLISIVNSVLTPAESTIFWEIRLPRALMAFLVGASLSLCGLLYQSFFRNPLASPFTLGVSSGASLGALLNIKFGLITGLYSISGNSIMAFTCAILTLIIVFLISRRSYLSEQGSMLLVGLSISYLFSSLILLVQYLSNSSENFQISRWLMGGLESSTMIGVIGVALFLSLLIIFMFKFSWELDLISIDEELATSRGINIPRIRNYLFLISSAVVGIIVSIAGPIGFIGIIIPHLSRFFVGNRHKNLILFSLFIGGGLLSICDLFSRLIIAPAEIPVGVITAIIGAPFFLFVLTGSKRLRFGSD